MNLYKPTINDLFHTHIIPAAYDNCIIQAELVIAYLDKRSYRCVSYLRNSRKGQRLSYYTALCLELQHPKQVDGFEYNTMLNQFIERSHKDLGTDMIRLVMVENKLDVMTKLMLVYDHIRNRSGLWELSTFDYIISGLKQAGELKHLCNKLCTFVYMSCFLIPLSPSISCYICLKIS